MTNEARNIAALSLIISNFSFLILGQSDLAFGLSLSPHPNPLPEGEGCKAIGASAYGCGGVGLPPETGCVGLARLDTRSM